MIQVFLFGKEIWIPFLVVNEVSFFDHSLNLPLGSTSSLYVDLIIVIIAPMAHSRH